MVYWETGRGMGVRFGRIFYNFINKHMIPNSGEHGGLVVEHWTSNRGLNSHRGHHVVSWSKTY